MPLWSTADEPALLECGDLSPLGLGRRNESGDKPPHSIIGLVICPSFALIPRRKPTSNFTPVKKDCVDTFAILLVVLSPYFLGA